MNVASIGYIWDVLSFCEKVGSILGREILRSSFRDWQQKTSLPLVQNTETDGKLITWRVMWYEGCCWETSGKIKPFPNLPIVFSLVNLKSIIQWRSADTFSRARSGHKTIQAVLQSSSVCAESGKEAGLSQTMRKDGRKAAVATLQLQATRQVWFPNLNIIMRIHCVTYATELPKCELITLGVGGSKSYPSPTLQLGSIHEWKCYWSW